MEHGGQLLPSDDLEPSVVEQLHGRIFAKDKLLKGVKVKLGRRNSPYCLATGEDKFCNGLRHINNGSQGRGYLEHHNDIKGFPGDPLHFSCRMLENGGICYAIPGESFGAFNHGHSIEAEGSLFDLRVIRGHTDIRNLRDILCELKCSCKEAFSCHHFEVLEWDSLATASGWNYCQDSRFRRHLSPTGLEG